MRDESVQRVRPLPAGYEDLSLGNGEYDVVIRTKAKDDLRKKATAEQRAGLDDLVRRYVTGGPTRVPPKKFNADEGWFPSDRAPAKVRLEAFKPWQLRAYGFCREFSGRPTFFITGVDPSKKKDQANQSILRAAGNEAARLNLELNQSWRR